MRWMLLLFCSGLLACSTTGAVMLAPYQSALIKAEPTTVDRQLMEEQNATTLSDALKNVPSVTR